MFPTKYDERERKFSCEGSRFAPVFSLKSKEAGNIELEITGEKNIYEAIQANKDSVSIKTIMARYELGDTDILNKRNGAFIDITDMPTNFADIMKTVITAENNFNELPLDVRKEYNFSPAEYISDIGSERWLKTLGIKDAKQAASIGENEKEDVKHEQE